MRGSHQSSRSDTSSPDMTVQTCRGGRQLPCPLEVFIPLEDVGFLDGSQKVLYGLTILQYLLEAVQLPATRAIDIDSILIVSIRATNSEYLEIPPARGALLL